MVVKLARITVAAAAILSVFTIACASSAEARSTACPGRYTGPRSGLGIFAIRADHVRCRVAKQVAVGWDNVGGKRRVYDARGRRWTCRITLRATGTDPGYNPFTHVRCDRLRSVVRFKLAS
jgi:hypothetical protein